MSRGNEGISGLYVCGWVKRGPSGIIGREIFGDDYSCPACWLLVPTTWDISSAVSTARLVVGHQYPQHVRSVSIQTFTCPVQN